MAPRFILHIILTLLLLSIGWWLYTQLTGGHSNLDSITVAAYWFAALVFIFFSWLFYWFVHRLSTTAWMIALIVSLVVTVISTLSLLYISRENQKKLVEEAIQQEQEKISEEKAQAEQPQQSETSNKIETLNLSEDNDELDEEDVNP